jgi:hypothetical protein
MGIRVSCPNGHVLNVKAYLAGKKGRCPSCGAVFQVPDSSADDELDLDSPRTAFDQIDIEQLTRESREAPRRPAGELGPNTGGTLSPAPGEESVSLALADAPAKSTPAENLVPADIASDLSAVWYVRRATGEQYGPAQGMMFWQWVQEGRVPEDSHVWKQGWAEWKSAKEWLARKSPSAPLHLPHSGPGPARTLAANAPSPAPTPAPSQSFSPGSRGSFPASTISAAPQSLPSASVHAAAAASRTIHRRKSSDVTAAIIVVLLLLFLASLTGAVIVVQQSMH